MKVPVRFAVVFAAALAFVPFLPSYVERTMTHVMFAYGGGGAIEWGWRRCTLSSFWANYHYMRPEQHPALWLAANVALALLYALVIAFSVARIVRGKRLRSSRSARVP